MKKYQRIVLLLFLSSPLFSATSVTWKQYTNVGSTWPYTVGWTQPFFEPSTQKTILWEQDDPSGSIYANSGWLFNDSTGTFTKSWSSGNGNSCVADGPTKAPQNRHFYFQGWYDPTRDLFFQMGGACGSTFTDFYYWSGPTFSTGTQVIAATAAITSNGGEGSAAYDSDDDAGFLFLRTNGDFPHLYVYCSTLGNPTPGVLTAAQSAVCSSPDVFIDTTPASIPNGASDIQAGAGMVYDSINHKIVMWEAAMAALWSVRRLGFIRL